MNLYDIQTEYLQLSESLIENGGELTTEIEEALKLNKENLETKGINYAFVIKEITNELETIDKEIERLKALKDSRTKSIDRLKFTLSNAMQLYDIDEIKTALIKVNFRKSESVEIQDLNLLSSDYINVKETITPNKTAIKEAIKNGIEVKGAMLLSNKNIQIK